MVDAQITKRSKKGEYLMSLAAYNQGVEQASLTLDYLCAFVDAPFSEFGVSDIGALASAIAALSEQLQFMSEVLADNKVILANDDNKEYIVLSKDQVVDLAQLSDVVEQKTQELRHLCHIRVEVN